MKTETTFSSSSSDAWTPYASKGNGKGHPTPEPADYGVAFITICLAMLVWRRRMTMSSGL